jgi:lipopolysaccharide export system protein LptC
MNPGRLAPLAPLAPLPPLPPGGPGEPAGQPRRSARYLLWRLWDSSSIYLPILLMAALALGSYWLLRSSPPPAEPRPPRAVSDEPDYYMRGFSVKSFNPEGRLVSELRGSEIRHYPASDALEVDNARVRSVAASGAVTTAQARRLTSNGAQTEYLLEGEAVVVRTPAEARAPRIEFRGEQLRVLVEADQLESDLPVLLIRGNDRIVADRMRYDDATGVANLQGRVKAVLAARP